MNKRMRILAEVAGLAWVSADAAWAIGDRLQINNTRLMTGLFIAAIFLGLVFIYMQAKERP